MSWFSVDNLKELGKQVQSVGKQVQSAIPKLDQEMLQKLTLTTPELRAERQRIDEEEKHKERVKNTLAGMLPWETRDPERDILVEECKEAILQLSADKETFHGPYEMPKASVNLNTPTSSKDEGDVEETIQEPLSPNKPSAKSLEKLKTLEPLPILLDDFDLDSHVGLIEKLLKADPKLVEMQSTLSGGGEHEVVFWRNYFFHCAWCRYEAGLSIDEIWSDEPASEADANVVSTGEAAEEETITFEDKDVEREEEKAFPAEPTTDTDAPFSKATPEKETSSSPAEGVSTSSNSADFELVSGEDGDAGTMDAIDYELDELEAEIARELEG